MLLVTGIDGKPNENLVLIPEKNERLHLTQALSFRSAIRRVFGAFAPIFPRKMPR
jgi:hypothetical protein